MLSKSRLHRIRDLFYAVSVFFSDIRKNLNTDSVWLTDTFPVSVCDNIRIRLAEERVTGDSTHRNGGIFTVSGFICHAPAEGNRLNFFTPGSVNDAGGLELFNFNFPENSTGYGAKAYSNCEIEDFLRETGL